MVTNFKRMDEIRRILQCYGNCGSFKETARKMQVSRNTVKKYVHVCRDRQISLFRVSQLNDEQLKSLFYVPETAKEYTRQEYFESRVEYWVGELRRKGVTRHLLWEEYLEQTPDGFKYAQYCDRLRQYIKRTDLTLAMEHAAGEKAMIDYTGSKASWYDPKTGEKRWAEVLVVVLPNSQYTFAIALSSQKLPDFIYGLNKALEYFGGVPKILLSDNLRAYVKRLDRYEPSFTDMSVQLAAHYNVELQATRVARPKDKGSVENAVSTTYKRLYAPLRNRTFYSINQIKLTTYTIEGVVSSQNATNITLIGDELTVTWKVGAYHWDEFYNGGNYGETEGIVDIKVINDCPTGESRIFTLKTLLHRGIHNYNSEKKYFLYQ